MRRILLFVTMAGLAGGTQAADESRVTLPLDEFLATKRTADRSKDRFAIASALSTAAVRLRLEENRLVGEGVFEVAVFAEGWNITPLLGGDLAPESWEPSSGSVIAYNGWLVLVTNQPGRQTVTIRLASPATDTSNWEIRLPESASGSVEVDSANTKTMPLVEASGARLTSRSAIFTGSGGTVRIRAVPQMSDESTTWMPVVQSLATVDEDLVRLTHHVQLLGDSGTGKLCRLELPPGGLRVECTGEDLASYAVTETEGSPSILTLRWQTRGILERNVTIRYSIIKRDPEAPWTINPLRVQGGSLPGRATLALSAGNDSRIVLPEGVAPLSASSLPEWIQKETQQKETVACRFDHQLSFSTRPLPRVETATSTISSARFSTRLVADGALYSEASLEVDHRDDARLILRLPEESRLLTFEVEGAARDPILQPDGSLEARLPGGSATNEKRSRVLAGYTSKVGPFDPVRGRLKLELPESPLFIEDLAWTVHLPEGYQATAFDGNVEPIANSKEPGLHFRKRLSRGDRASIEIFYRKHQAN